MKPLDYFDHYARNYHAYKEGAWCYEDSCAYRGLLLLHEVTGEQRWLDHVLRLSDRQIGPDGQLADYDPAEFNIDNILGGRILLPLARLTGDDRYLAAARDLIGQLEKHPRTTSGNYWHKLRYPHQVWLDGLYMGLPFQIEYALLMGDKALVSDALTQFSNALKLTATVGDMHVHGYDESRTQAWADPISGRSAAVWSRAMGWLAMALVDGLSFLPADAETDELRAKTFAILRALRQRQAPSGLWPQVIDAPDLQGNYEESSASAMFAYAFLRAASSGLAKGPAAAGLLEAGQEALRALTESRLVSENGETRFAGICLVAGLGAMSGRFRDGSPSYYLSEPVVADDAKGVGPFMMAYAESLRVAVEPAIATRTETTV